MSDKTLISLRISAEALAALDTWPGKSRTDQIESLILWATLQRPTLEDDLDQLRQQIDAARAELRDLQDLRRRLARVGDLLDQAAASLDCDTSERSRRA